MRRISPWRKSRPSPSPPAMPTSAAAGLAGAVDHAAHDRHGDGLGAALPARRSTSLGHGDQVDAGAAAGGAGDQIRRRPAAARPPAGSSCAAQTSSTGSAVRRDPDGVADAHGTAGRRCPWRTSARPMRWRARLGHAQMQRIVRLLRSAAGRPRMVSGTLEDLTDTQMSSKIAAVQQLDMAQGALHQRLRRGRRRIWPAVPFPASRR